MTMTGRCFRLVANLRRSDTADRLEPDFAEGPHPRLAR
jgi:hypothetical protein